MTNELTVEAARRIKIYAGGRLAGYLESDEGCEAWHWVGSPRSRKFAGLGHAFGSVWDSIHEFRSAVKRPIVIQF